MPASRIRQNPELFAQLDPVEQDAVRRGEVAVGFTSDMVRLALGEPDRVETRTDIAGSEIWNYTTYAGLWRDRFRVIFRNGIVTATERDSKPTND